MLVVIAGLAGRPAALAQSGAAPAQRPSGVAHFANGGNAAEIPVDFLDHLVFIPVRVNQGEPSLFELDSTARVSSIDPGRSAELGLGMLTSPVLNLSGVNIALPALPEEAQPTFAARFGRRYQGTLGNDFLASVVAEVDYARQTLQLYDPAVYKYSGHGKSFHLEFVAGMPVVKAKFQIEGGRTTEADFIVNTALDAPALLFDRGALKGSISGRRTISAASLPLDGAEGDVIARMNRFQLGRYTVESSLAVISRQDPPTKQDARIAGEIGAGMLRRFGVVFDYAHQQILLDPNSEFQSEDFENMSGLTIVAGGPNLRRFEITEVRPDTPGADAGLRKGDIIEGIGGDPAAEMSLADIRKLFHQIGTPYSVVITRGGKTLTVMLGMHRLL
jgi:PDZ domain